MKGLNGDIIANVMVANGITLILISIAGFAYGQYLCYVEGDAIEKKYCR